MNEFKIVIDLVVTAGSCDHVKTMLADSGVDYGDAAISMYGHKLSETYAYGERWDVVMTKTITTQTVRTAAATLGDDFRRSLREIDPYWVAHVFYDKAEVLELDAWDREI